MDKVIKSKENMNMVLILLTSWKDARCELLLEIKTGLAFGFYWPSISIKTVDHPTPLFQEWMEEKCKLENLQVRN